MTEMKSWAKNSTKPIALFIVRERKPGGKKRNIFNSCLNIMSDLFKISKMVFDKP